MTRYPTLVRVGVGRAKTDVGRGKGSILKTATLIFPTRNQAFCFGTVLVFNGDFSFKGIIACRVLSFPAGLEPGRGL